VQLLLPLMSLRVANSLSEATDESQYDAPVLVNNKIPQTPIKIVKVDAETGVQIPVAASFEIYDASGNIVTYTSRYPETHVMDRWTTNERGELTLPMLLEEGTYTLREVVAPEGYVLADEDITFTVDAEYRSWDDPTEIEINKVDEFDNEITLEGATFRIWNDEGTLDEEFATNTDGVIDLKYIQHGSYHMQEVAAPDGYAITDLDTEGAATIYDFVVND
jgi:hypothetical protein